MTTEVEIKLGWMAYLRINNSSCFFRVAGEQLQKYGNNTVYTLPHNEHTQIFFLTKQLAQPSCVSIVQANVHVNV
jgi:hypothetical protein